jgi:hypothetical protein
VGLRVRIAVERDLERRKNITEECQLLTERKYKELSSAKVSEDAVGRKMFSKVH